MRLLLIIGLVFTYFGISAQNVIKGRVIDKKTGESIPGASVYVSNTSFGTATNPEGYFTLTDFPTLPFYLNISSIGYEIAVIEINKIEGAFFNVELVVKSRMLDEVVITDNWDEQWAKYSAIFLNNFIGYSQFSAECKILNKEAINFIMDDETKLLTVYIDEPIIIVNKALGFKITYWLENFTYSFRTRQSMVEGYPFFQEMITSETKKKKLKKWNKNRLSSYKGSLNHFMRTLYQGNTAKEGFKVDILKKVQIGDAYQKEQKVMDTVYYNNETIQEIYNTIAQSNSISSEKIATYFLKRVKEWYQDTTRTENLRIVLSEIVDGEPVRKAYELAKDQLNPEKVVVSNYPVDAAIERQAKGGLINVITDQDVDVTQFVEQDTASQTKRFGFKDYLHITYTKELEEKEYLGLFSNKAPQNQSNVLSLQGFAFIYIYPDGNFSPPAAVLVEKYWAFEKMDKMLPLNYQVDRK